MSLVRGGGKEWVEVCGVFELVVTEGRPGERLPLSVSVSVSVSCQSVVRQLSALIATTNRTIRETKPARGGAATGEKRTRRERETR